jgi:hypothetical protein
MSHSFGLTGYGNLSEFRGSHTGLVRIWVIASITVSIIGITFISMAAGNAGLAPQLFYFPILYSTYFYPDRGIYVACGCALAYAMVAGYFVVLNPLAVGGIIVQSALFIGIAAGSAYVLRSRAGSPPSAPAGDAEAVRAMIDAGENDRVEFKRRTLWSSDLPKEEILASESPELRKYRNNASKFIIARSIAGFLNTDGGDLIIGVREDRMHNAAQIVGIGEDYRILHEKDRNPDGYRRMLVDAVIRKYLPEIVDTVSKFIHISFPSVSGTTVCHVHITRSDRPVFVDIGNEELFFIRVDASTRPVTGKALTSYILTRFSAH